MMTNNQNKEEEQPIQKGIENLLRNNPSRSYSKEEIMNLMSSDISMQEKIDKVLGEMEIWSSMEHSQSSVYSSCKGGTVYFQWEHTP